MKDLPPEIWHLIRKHERKLKFLETKSKLETFGLFENLILVNGEEPDSQLFFMKTKNNGLIAGYTMIKRNFVHFEKGLYKLAMFDEVKNRDIELVDNIIYDSIPNFRNYKPIVIETYTSPMIEGWHAQYVYTYSQIRGWVLTHPFLRN